MYLPTVGYLLENREVGTREIKWSRERHLYHGKVYIYRELNFRCQINTRKYNMKFTLILMVTQIKAEDEPSWNYIQGKCSNENFRC